MKNATAYEKKIRKFLGTLPKAHAAAIAQDDKLEQLVLSVLEADTTPKQAHKALAEIKSEFVDHNELRVAPHKDIIECIGRDFPGAREKAESVVKSLNGLFDHGGGLSVEYMNKMPKRELRRHLMELGLSPFAAALVVLTVFEGHAVPVDRSLQICLEADGMVHPESDLADIQGFLERVIAQKDAMGAHEFFRAYIEKNAKMLETRRKAEAAAAAASESAAMEGASKPSREKIEDTAAQAREEPAPAPGPEAAAAAPKASKGLAKAPRPGKAKAARKSGKPRGNKG